MLEMLVAFLFWLISFLMVGFFAGSETALVRIDDLTLKHTLERGAKGAETVQQLLEDKQKLLATLLVGTNLMVVISTVLATVLLRNAHPFGISGSAVATWGMVVLILIFGEIIPKRLATSHSVSFALRVARPVKFFNWLFGPVAVVLTQIPRSFGHRIADEVESPTINTDSLLTMVEMGEEDGAVLEEEHDMIIGVLEADETLVREIMVPRVDMVAVEVNDPVEEVLRKIVESGFSRIPVYENTTDNIVGVLYTKDLLASGLLNHWSRQESISVGKIMRTAYFVPEAKNVADLLSEMKSLHIHLAIVVDEYGGTAGIVTIEDLLEEIVGEIQDEYDGDEEEGAIELDEGEWLVDARLPIDEVNELLDVDLPDDQVDTIGGLAYLWFGRIPATGEMVSQDDYGITLVIAAASGLKIDRVKIVRHAEARQAAGQ